MSFFILRQGGIAIAVWLVKNLLTSSATSNKNPPKYLQKSLLQGENKAVTHDKTKTMVQRQIRFIIFDLCARHAVRNILGIGDGTQSLCHDLQAAGYTIDMLRVNQEAVSTQTGFDMAITIESGQSPLNPAELITFAAARLQPGGIFILTIPYLGYLKKLVMNCLVLRDLPRLPSSSRKGLCYWSTCKLIKKLKLNGFETLELIGVRDASLSWNSLIFVTRKAFG